MNCIHQAFILVLLLLGLRGQCQSLGNTKFQEVLPVLPQPKSSLEETYESFGSDPDPLLGGFDEQARQHRSRIIVSFLERFRKNIRAIKATPSLLQSFSPEEQQMMQAFQRGTTGFDESNQLIYFAMQMETRPLAGTANLSWDKVGVSLPADTRSIYQQILAIEKKLDWPIFYKQASQRNLVHHDFTGDEALENIARELEGEMEKLPLKKVKIFENIDQTAEMKDPGRMVELLKAASAKRQAHFRNRFAAIHAWWTRYEARIREAAGEFDALRVKLESNPNGQPIIAVAAGVQERIWSALIQLNYVTRTLVMYAQSSAADRSTTQESIEMYQKLR